MKARAQAIAPRGAPLVMLAALLTAWTGARALWWENPFPQVGKVLAPVTAPVLGPVAQRMSEGVVEALASEVTGPVIARVHLAAPPQIRFRGVNPGTAATALVPALALPFADPRASVRPAPSAPQLAAAHHLLLRAALYQPGTPLTGLRDDEGVPGGRTRGSAPFLPPVDPARRGLRRWTVDGWAFWRQGSDSTAVSQGRVPIYGASQIGAVLQYRLAREGSRRDPRLFARAYRSLVRRGESEVSLGASLRPLPRIPLRAAAEVRYTDAAFTNEIRPAAFAVTELPPVELPLGARFEAYGQAGWVGGASRTAFADGQASVTREVGAVARASHDKMRLSLGAAGWGGAQRNAERLDVGPTMRLDLKVGEVPARFSVDWRERVAGDAGPESGVAATLSTHF